MYVYCVYILWSIGDRMERWWKYYNYKQEEEKEGRDQLRRWWAIIILKEKQVLNS